MKPPLLGSLSPFAKILFTVLLVLSSATVFMLAGILLAIPLFHVNLLNDFTAVSDFRNPTALPVLKFLQIVQSAGIFIVPALLAGFFFHRNMSGYLGLDRRMDFYVVLLAIGVLVVSLPLLDWMGRMNGAMKFPEGLGGLESWMKESEDQAGKLTDAFLDVKSWGGFAVNLLMIAIIPALGEEMFFRGLLQRLFSEWFRNPYAGIIVTAFLFGAIHLQFYGLLPRFALGILFGYFYYRTGSLWLPVLCHFLNNGTAVVLSFLTARGIIRLDYETLGSTENVLYLVISAVLTVFLILAIYRVSRVKVSGAEIPGNEQY